MAEQREVNMRRPPGIVVIAPRISARLHGKKLIAAFGVGDGAARAGEIRIERGGMLIDHVHIAPGSIGLPDLDQRIRHRLAVLIEHAAVHNDALAQRLALMLLGQIGIARLHGFVSINRTGELGKRMRRR